jgi:hypothetical protein
VSIAIDNSLAWDFSTYSVIFDSFHHKIRIKSILYTISFNEKWGTANIKRKIGEEIN